MITVFESVCITDSFNLDFFEYCYKKSFNELIYYSDLFEQYLYFKQYKKNIIEWENISNSYFEIIWTPISIKIAEQNNLNNLSFFENFKYLSNIFLNFSIQRSLFIYLSLPSIEKIINKYKNLFEELKLLFENILKEKLEKVNSFLINSLSISSQSIFWETIEQLRSLNNVPLLRSFNIIINSLNNLYTITVPKNRSDFFEIAIIFSNVIFLPELFLIFKTFLMKSSLFLTIFPENFLLIWTIFEQYILKISEKNKKFQTLLLKMELLCLRE